MKPHLYTYIYFLMLIPVLSGLDYTYGQQVKPKWIDYSARDAMFPQTDYVTGFASEVKKENQQSDDLIDQLRNLARMQLTESVNITIRSEVSVKIENINSKTNSYFKQASISVSGLNISGLKEEQYFDQKEKVLYFLTYARKKDISTQYRNSISDLRGKIILKKSEGDSYAKAGNKTAALEAYIDCFQLLRETEEGQALISVFEMVSINSAGLFFEELNSIENSIHNAIMLLQKSDQNTLDEACYFLASGLKLKLKPAGKNIRVANFTFQDTKMSSLLSRRLTATLEEKLSSLDFPVNTLPVSVSGNKNINDETLHLTGTYWEEGLNLKIIAILRDISGNIIASNEALLPIQWTITNNINYKPDNYSEAIANMLVYSKSMVINNGGLSLEISTSKGNENPLFIEGDTMVLYIRTNKPCYVRVIYHFADGNKVLFLDNYYVANDMVNKIIEIPQKFECFEPYGVEFLLANAQSEPFKPLKTHIDSNNNLFIDETPENVVLTQRGFKPVSNKDLKAEKMLTITTLKK